MPRRTPEQRKSDEELREIQKILTKYSKLPEFQGIIKRELSKIEGPAMAKVQAKIRAIPSRTRNRGSRGGRQTSLRREMVQALRFNVDTSKTYTGAFLWLDARRMPLDRDNLPAYMEGVPRYTRWRHQVFGNEEVWVTQKRHPYFYRTLRPFEIQTAKAAEAAIKAIGKDLKA